MPPLDCKPLRKALSASLDRTALIQHVLKGGQAVATSILPPCLSLGEGSIDDGDEEKAWAYLQEALEILGCTVQELPPIVYTYATVEGHKAIAQAIQQRWQQVLGVRVTLQGMEWNQYVSKMARAEHQLAAAPWYSWHNDPIYNLEMLKSTDRYNPTQWQHPDYRSLLERADQTYKESEREALLRCAEQMVIEAMPVAPLFVTSYKYVADDRLLGVFVSELGQIDFRWAELKSCDP